jgi:N-methylhydantoinase B
MFCGVYMIMVFDPQILFNDGFYDLMEVRIPDGTLLKPRAPAALSCRTHALGRIFDILGGLLGQGNPDFLCAAGFSDSPHLMYSGYDKTASGTSCSRSASAAFRASLRRRPGRALAVAVVHQRAQRVPRELFPAAHREPTKRSRLRRCRQAPRRQCAARRLPLPGRGQISIHDDRWLTYPWGVNGGLPGARSRKLLSARTARRTAAFQVRPHQGLRRRVAVSSTPGAAAAGAIPSSGRPNRSRSTSKPGWSRAKVPSATAW